MQMSAYWCFCDVYPPKLYVGQGTLPIRIWKVLCIFSKTVSSATGLWSELQKESNKEFLTKVRNELKPSKTI